jgi:uncharacterized protein
MKKELKILGLSYSQTQIGSYIIVLSDKNGKRKLPIIIKPSEAQKIAIEIEGIVSTRPMIYDLFKTITEFYNMRVIEVFIYDIVESIFYTKIKITDGLNEVDVDCTAGDGIALSTLYKCPIYTTNEVLEVAGIYINDDGSPIDESESQITLEELEKQLSVAIENEEYEIAAELRDRIEKMKG